MFNSVCTTVLLERATYFNTVIVELSGFIRRAITDVLVFAVYLVDGGAVEDLANHHHVISTELRHHFTHLVDGGAEENLAHHHHVTSTEHRHHLSHLANGGAGENLAHHHRVANTVHHHRHHHHFTHLANGGAEENLAHREHGQHEELGQPLAGGAEGSRHVDEQKAWLEHEEDELGQGRDRVLGVGGRRDGSWKTRGREGYRQLVQRSMMVVVVVVMVLGIQKESGRGEGKGAGEREREKERGKEAGSSST